MKRGRRRCRCVGCASLGGFSDAAPPSHVGHDTALGLRLSVPVPGRPALARADHRPGGPRPGHVLLRPVLSLRHRDAAVAVHVGVGQQGIRQVRLREGLPAPPGHGGEMAGHLGPQGRVPRSGRPGRAVGTGLATGRPGTAQSPRSRSDALQRTGLRRRPGPADRGGGRAGGVGDRSCRVERRAVGGDRRAHRVRTPRGSQRCRRCAR